MKNVFKFILSIGLLTFFACSSSEGIDENIEAKRQGKNEKVIFVASKKGDCVGVAAQKCLLVKESQGQDWIFFYDVIQGFDYKEGFEYKLLVSETEIVDPPADASSVLTTLVKVISKTKKDSSI